MVGRTEWWVGSGLEGKTKRKREKGKRGLINKENRKQGSWEKGMKRIRKGKEINHDAHTARYIKNQATQIMDSISLVTFLLVIYNQRLRSVGDNDQ